MKRGVSSSMTRKVLAAVSVLGTVQVLSMLCSVVRTKLAAVWIGPIGVGMIALYFTNAQLITDLCLMNLRNSAVRDLSANSAEENAHHTATLVRTLGKMLGTIGMLATVVLSPLLSRWAFGDWTHIWGFILLGLMPYFLGVSNAEMAVMQGFERLKLLAKCSLWQAVGGVAISVPLLYFLRLDSVVWTILGYAFAIWVVTRLLRLRDVGSDEKISWRQAWIEGRPMLALGFYMTIGAIVTLLASNIFLVFLRSHYSEAEVGIYQSGFTLMNAYMGLFFTAIGLEYYPRLSANIKHRFRTCVLVSHEMAVSLYVLMPLIVAFMCCDRLIVTILYDSTFEAMLPYIATASVGMILRATSWCMAFTILARGDGRVFVLTESISAIVNLILNVVFYRMWGFFGVGIAYILWYVIYTAIVAVIYYRNYSLHLQRGMWQFMLVAIIVTTAALISRLYFGPIVTAIIALPPLIYLAYRKLLA